MDELTTAVGDMIAAVGDMIAAAGFTERVLRDHNLITEADSLAASANGLIAALPRLAARPDADRAAVLLLAAGAELYGEEGQESPATKRWRKAEEQALALLGVVPLTPAA